MFSYRIDETQKIIYTTVTITPTTLTMMDHIQKVMSDPGFDPNYSSVIIVGEDTTIPGIPPEKIDTIRALFDGYAQKRKNKKWAVVVPNQRTESFLKVNLEMLKPLELDIRIFFNEGDAIEWINQIEIT